MWLSHIDRNYGMCENIADPISSGEQSIKVPDIAMFSIYRHDLWLAHTVHINISFKNLLCLVGHTPTFFYNLPLP